MRRGFLGALAFVAVGIPATPRTGEAQESTGFRLGIGGSVVSALDEDGHGASLRAGYGAVLAEDWTATLNLIGGLADTGSSLSPSNQWRWSFIGLEVGISRALRERFEVSLAVPLMRVTGAWGGSSVRPLGGAGDVQNDDLDGTQVGVEVGLGVRTSDHSAVELVAGWLRTELDNASGTARSGIWRTVELRLRLDRLFEGPL